VDTVRIGGQKTSFWQSIGLGLPLLFLLTSDFFNLSKPSKEGSGMFMDAETYRLAVFGSVYVISIWMIYLRRADFYSLMRGHWIYLLFLGYCFSTFLWSAFPIKSITFCGHLLGHYLVAVAGLLMFRGNEVSLIRVYSLFSYVFVPACLVTAFFFPDRNLHVETNRWMGLTWNPNSLGGAVMIGVWANVSYLLYVEKYLMRLWILLVLIGSFVLLVGSGSVTSLGLSALIVIGVPLFYWFAKSRNGITATFKMAYSGLIIFGALGFFYATQPELFDPNRLLGSVGRDSNLTGRATLWAIADAAIDERPWLGWSFDGLKSLPTKYQITYNQFHNGYLDLMVRGGRIALGFVIFFALTLAIRIINLAPVKQAMAASYGVLLLVILLHNVSEASFASGPNPLWLLFTFIYIGATPRISRWYETGVLDELKKRTKGKVENMAPPLAGIGLARTYNKPPRG
jgi:exopolysaccharide production protein ExoQ